MKVLITRPWPAPALEKIIKQFPDVVVRESNAGMDRTQTVEALCNYDIIAPTLGDKFSPETFSDAGASIRTKLLANFGVGYDHIDVTAANSAGVQVTNTPGVLTDATADIAIMLMLMALRRANDARETLYNSVEPWTGWNPTQLMGQGLKGKTIGIVGMGRIGKEVARRAFLAFNMNVLYFNRTPRPGVMGLVAAQVEDTNTLCQKSDVVSINAASTPETRGIIGQEQIDLIGPKGCLINTARGDLIDEEAAMDALDDGRLGSIGLDVFQGEPNINPRWFNTPRATLLPHIGSGTIETRTAMALKSFANMKAFANGEPLIDPVR